MVYGLIFFGWNLTCALWNSTCSFEPYTAIYAFYDMLKIWRPLIHYRQKIWNIFYVSDFLHFCAVYRAFLYSRYISTSKYYFWGSWFALNSKMKRDGSKTIVSVYFSIRLWLEFLLSLRQIAAISIRVLYRDIVHNTIVYLLPFLVRSAGD